MHDETKLRLLTKPDYPDEVDHPLLEQLAGLGLVVEEKRSISKRREGRFGKPFGQRTWKVTGDGRRELAKLSRRSADGAT